MRNLKHTLVIATYAALAASSSPVSAENPLSVAEVKALITGNTVYMQNLENKLFLRMHYEPSGQFVVLRDDGARYDGLWSVRADGTLCVIAQGEICGKIQKNTDGTYTRMVGGAPAFKWLTITPGKDF